MAGTNKSLQAVTGGPLFVLVRPQLGENVGMAARAMLNCGLTELRLVAPRDSYQSDAALSAAAGAHELIENAQLFPTLRDALADVERIYATSARPRELVRRLLTPRAAAAEMHGEVSAGRKVALVFGPERAGLTNEDLALAEAVVQVPLNPAFSSLNLAQAVLLLGYEWFQLREDAPAEVMDYNASRAANHAELRNLLDRLEGMLDESGFLFPPEKRPSMLDNLRSFFARSRISEQEVRTFHGVISALWLYPRKKGGAQASDQESE